MIKICRRVGWEVEKSARIRAVLRIHR
jgi:hypothetical protein